jgi:predicted nucleotidyltransferase
MDLHTLRERLIAFFADQPDVAAAYLFGSAARGEATPRSDLDMAVLLAPAPTSPQEEWERREALSKALSRIVGRPVDVVILNRAPPLLCHQVLREGQRIYERDPEARIEFEVRAGKIYADLRPMWDFFDRILEQELEEGRFGEPRRGHPGKASLASKRGRLSKKRKG